MPVTIYHNTRCSKSRATLKLIEEAGFQAEIIDYMKHPPAPETLEVLLQKLGMQAKDLVRRNETAFKGAGLDQADERTLIEAMSREPRLIQRPIVVRGQRARLGRPPEDVLEILE
ncbi:arsenate reductase [Natronospira proteinivora]|uniref:Arsenate reductase n=1 Tax=Natronospira proteinivora TaxID=1807133 RepID=A0ABT1G4F1_9GAMM|nr:arsenate reductase (glutaredoxin) [Natronospira proteinivora]MCP1726169.1 arsenate reductase [Natronospira proteinivora]